MRKNLQTKAGFDSGHLVWYRNKRGKKALNEITMRLDTVITLLEALVRPRPLAHKIASGFATGAGILGILGAIEVVRTWFGE
jgi:hypothetical protein